MEAGEPFGPRRLRSDCDHDERKLTATLKPAFNLGAYHIAMSYPVAVPDRRLLARRTCAQSCVVYFGLGDSVPAILHQLDGLGARLRLLGQPSHTPGRLKIVLEDGDELFGDATWRIGDFVGVSRAPGGAGSADVSERAQAA